MQMQQQQLYCETILFLHVIRVAHVHIENEWCGKGRKRVRAEDDGEAMPVALH